MNLKHWLLCLVIVSCSYRPKAISYGTDVCSFCNMTLVDPRFSTQKITAKGKVYSYDDYVCMQMDSIEGKAYFSRFDPPHDFIEIDKIILRESEIQSPMGGNKAAYAED